MDSTTTRKQLWINMEKQMEGMGTGSTLSESYYGILILKVVKLDDEQYAFRVIDQDWQVGDLEDAARAAMQERNRMAGREP